VLGPPPQSTPRSDSKSGNQMTKKLWQHAKYQWSMPEQSDWGNVISRAGGCTSELWRQKLCRQQGPIKRQFLGGVSRCHQGSAGILLAYRYIAWYLLQELRLLQHYEWIVFTRSDYLFACPPKEDLGTLPRDKIYVPRSSGYGGVTDRYTLMPSSLALLALNVTADIVRNHQRYDLKHGGRYGMNLEWVLMTYFQRAGLDVGRLCHTAFTALSSSDDTRWSHRKTPGQGSMLKRLGFSVKYPQELNEVQECCSMKLAGGKGLNRLKGSLLAQSGAMTANSTFGVEPTVPIDLSSVICVASRPIATPHTGPARLQAGDMVVWDLADDKATGPTKRPNPGPARQHPGSTRYPFQ